MTGEINHVSQSGRPEINDSCLNGLELTSIRALLAYTAQEQKVSQEIVRNIVATYFGVDDVSHLRGSCYDEVIKFMVDLQVAIYLN